MKHARFISGFTVLALVSGCPRSSPPEVRKFRPPGRIGIVDSMPAEVVADVSPSRPPEPPPVPELVEAPPARTTAPAAVMVAAKPVAPPPEAPRVATIVGTWRAIEMSHNGQTMPMPAEMQMTWTFTADGAFKMSAGQMSESMEGTYTTSGDQITITMRGESKTGAYQLDGDRLTINIDQGKITLQRT